MTTYLEQDRNTRYYLTDETEAYTYFDQVLSFSVEIVKLDNFDIRLLDQMSFIIYDYKQEYNGKF